MTSTNGSPLTLEEDEEAVAISLSTSSIIWIVIYINGIPLSLVIVTKPLISYLSSAFVMALSLFLLSTRHLLTIYVWLASIGVILWSYVCNEEYNKYVFSLKESTLAYELISFNLNAIFRFVANYMFQVFIDL